MTESILLVLVLSLDAFLASIAYGTNKIKIPLKSIIIIVLACSSILTFSILLGSLTKNIIPLNLDSIFSFLILLTLGVFYLFQSIVKAYIRKSSNKNKKLELKVSDLIVNIYIDEINADFDNSKSINPKEAFFLAIVLSLDSLAVGFSSGLGNIDYIQVIFLSLIGGILAICMGLFIGQKFVENSKVDVSWLSGILLLILAFKKLL